MRLPHSVLLAIAFFTVAYGAILGIDLGQDFTKAAVVAPGVPFEIVMSADSKRKDVSGLAIKKLGKDEIERIYGSATNSLFTRFPKNCLLNFKALLGKSTEDPVVTHYLTSHPSVDLVPSKRDTIEFKIDDNTYPVEEVLAMNLQNIADRASLILKEKAPGGYSQINDIAVTVPGFFTESQRNAIQDAATLSGFKTIALVDDGVAIATNFATNRDFTVGKKESHIIYDMGAGSTKATLVSFLKLNETQPLQIVVEGYSYDEALGGTFFTNSVAELIKNKFLESYSKIRSDILNSNSRAIAKIYQSAEKAKLVLSANNEAHISIESIIDDIDFKSKITREEFEEIISDSAPRISAPIIHALQDADLNLEDISSVIYAGGSTRVPFVQQHLLSLLGEELISKTINADEAAVLGTTLRGVQISKMFKAKEFNVTNNSIYNYRTIFDDDTEHLVFPRGSSYGIQQEIDITDNFVPGKAIGFDLAEDNRRFLQHIIPQDYKHSFNESNCVSDVKIFANFDLSESRLFKLEAIEARCELQSAEKEKGFLDKLKGDTKTEIAPRYARSKVPFKTDYFPKRPLGNVAIQDLKYHIQQLNAKDLQRKQLSEKLNELEATLYSARNYIEDDEVNTHGPSSVIESLQKSITENLEWLDYESENAKVKEIKQKIESIKTYRKQIEKYIKQSSIPLDEEEFKNIHESLSQSLESSETTLNSLAQESLDISEKFSQIGLDYAKELTKLTKVAQSLPKKEFEEANEKVSSIFKEIEKLLSNSKNIKSKSREELFELREKALTNLEVLTKIEKQFKLTHSQRLKELNGAIVRFYKAQKRAEQKAKEEEAKKKAAKIDTDAIEQEGFHDNDDDIFEDAFEDASEGDGIEDESKFSKNKDHDEL
ncbi:hypothetical protein WICMUC_002744 [Wickerhamomyces mucosus]|uniref:Uncharacterized protein n=1 Tax=Wickerhamomyces mucosus TaxID=1378264 RepID=A0A9P8TEB6_9ASCO|nr:hypothetical protein WICMUC_002744 [Wickerhamomyces mucosus]